MNPGTQCVAVERFTALSGSLSGNRMSQPRLSGTHNEDRRGLTSFDEFDCTIRNAVGDALMKARTQASTAVPATGRTRPSARSISYSCGRPSKAERIFLTKGLHSSECYLGKQHLMPLISGSRPLKQTCRLHALPRAWHCGNASSPCSRASNSLQCWSSRAG
jgi:hypothetical protein